MTHAPLRKDASARAQRRAEDGKKKQNTMITNYPLITAIGRNFRTFLEMPASWPTHHLHPSPSTSIAHILHVLVALGRLLHHQLG